MPYIPSNRCMENFLCHQSERQVIQTIKHRARIFYVKEKKTTWRQSFSIENEARNHKRNVPNNKIKRRMQNIHVPSFRLIFNFTDE